jgi:hypothetical protein
MNLDTLCAQCGYDVVHDEAPTLKLARDKKNKLENTVTKSLGVLQEDGIYAFFLFLDYYRGEKGAASIANHAKELLRRQEVDLLTSENSDDWEAIRELTNDLDDLLLARQLLEQALIYARYHAKALEEISEEQS